MPQARNGRNEVFVSYSHADDEYLKRLRVHLGLLERRNIKIWTDKDIEPGMKWQDEIRDIRIELAGDVRRVQAVALGRTLPIEGAGPRRWFTLPRLQAYEVLVLE